MRFGVFTLLLLLGITTAAATTSSRALGDEPPPIETYVAHLDGAGMDPPVDTKAQGEATLRWDGVELSMKLVAAIIEPDTVEVIDDHGTVTSFKYDQQGRVLIDGEPWTKLDIEEPQELVDAIHRNDVFVHFSAIQGDGIRGQVLAKPVSVKPY